MALTLAELARKIEKSKISDFSASSALPRGSYKPPPLRRWVIDIHYQKIHRRGQLSIRVLERTRIFHETSFLNLPENMAGK